MGTYTQRDSPGRPWTPGAALLVIGFWAIAAGGWWWYSAKCDAQRTDVCRAACAHVGADGQRFGTKCLCSNGVRPFAW